MFIKISPTALLWLEMQNYKANTDTGEIYSRVGKGKRCNSSSTDWNGKNTSLLSNNKKIIRILNAEILKGYVNKES